MRNFFTAFGIVIAVGVALWFSAILFVGLAVLGGIGYGVYFLRDYLTAKGILNPTPGVPPQDSARITIIEGEYEEIKHSQE